MSITQEDAQEIIDLLTVDLESALIRAIRNQFEHIRDHQKYFTVSPEQYQLLEEIADNPDELVKNILQRKQKDTLTLLQEYINAAELELNKGTE